MDLDSVDRRILALLQMDGRITNQNLADRVGLSPSACLRRVQILERAGIIEGYAAVVNAAALGYGFTVIVQITLERQTEEYLSRFEAELIRHPEVLEGYLMSGVSDYLVRVLLRNAGDYERLHQELSRLPGVARIHSNFTLRTVVRRTSLPVEPGTFPGVKNPR